MNKLFVDVSSQLAHVRNMLSKGKFGIEEKEILVSVEKFSNEVNGPFAGLIEKCIGNCFFDIEKNNFKSASLEINFIHNFPIRNSDIQKWDEDHFYLVEVLSYFELTEKYERVKLYIFEIARAQEKIGSGGFVPRGQTK